jgi:hypothetical protein
MEQPHRFNAPLAVYAGVIAFVFACASQAHAQVARIGSPPARALPGVNAVAPVKPSAAGTAALAAPRATGLQPVVPAGLTAGSGAAVSRDPVAASTALTSPAATAATNTVVTGNDSFVPATGGVVAGGGTSVTIPEVAAFAAPNTATMGAAAANLARGPSATVPLGGAGYSAVDIARSFITADGNRDGELTRGEASRLSLALMSFEEMDRNYDGVISRGEYEDGLR